MTNRFYQMVKTGQTVDIDIYGNITPWALKDRGEVSAYGFTSELEAMGEVSRINVYINSCGGSVAEGLAIYNTLKRNPAHVATYCDGFACSIASVIYMAGDERYMSKASLLMIHNASTGTFGTSAELRKAADDAEKITGASKAAYLERINITEKELTDLMDAETWISPAEALEMGFATAICDNEANTPTQSAMSRIIERVQAKTIGELVNESRLALQRALDQIDISQLDYDQSSDEEDQEPPDPNDTEDDQQKEVPENNLDDDPDSEDDEVTESALGAFFMAAFKN